MAFKRIVAKSEEDLETIMNKIMNWFDTTNQYESKKSTEKRRIQDPDTKKIIEKDIDVLKVTDTSNDKFSTIKFVPMIKKNEMKIEIGGEGEAAVTGKISNQIGNKGKLKSYSKDKKVPLKENKMKKSELKQLIKEEIQNSLKESTTNKFEEYAEYVYSKIDEGIVSKQTRGAIIRTLQEMRNEAENIERLFKENPF
jgi:hypothetical protein